VPTSRDCPEYGTVGMDILSVEVVEVEGLEVADALDPERLLLAPLFKFRLEAVVLVELMTRR